MNKFGLVLGGGGTKGAYHIGVWRALMKMNIDICAVVGTSIGSINGAMIAQGDAKIAEKLWENISLSDIIEISELGDVGENLFDVKNFKSIVSAVYKNNGIEAQPLKKLLENVIDENKIRNSKVDFGLVTYSLDELEEVKLFIDDIPSGKLIDYLMASAAMPGLKQPVIDEKKYIDGCVSNNIPANMLIEKGISDVITVDVGGFGVVKNIETTGINVINIKCSENAVGHLDFNEKNIDRMMKLGYFDTLRVFERVEGSIYSFNISDYHAKRLMYSKELIFGIERAAKIFDIDIFKVYKFDDLKNAVADIVLKKLEQFDSKESHGLPFDGLKLNEKQLLLKFVNHILTKEFEGMSNKIYQGLLGEVYSAANAVVYFIKEINI